MAADEPFLPLKKIRSTEKAVTWDDFCEDINLFLNFLAEHFVVEANRIADIAGVIVSNSEPSSSDRDKIWINQESPYFIAIYADGAWQKFYKYVDSDTTPPAVEDLVWIKKIEPYGLGAYIDGAWRMFYQYPEGIPMRWDITKTMPVGMRDATSTEITNYELTAPTNGKWKWVIFAPPAV